MVDLDLVLVIGLAMLCLSLPSLLSAMIEDRPPVVAGLGLALGTGLAAWGLVGKERALDPAALPHLVFEVLGRYLP